MSGRFAVIEGGEAWSSPGASERGRVAIALIHGFTGNPVSLRPLAEGLARRGYRVDLPRLPGHGTSWRDLYTTRYKDWRAEVVRVLDALLADTPYVFMAGLSMGGTLVLDVASEHSDRVCGIITINGNVLDRKGILVKLAPLLERILPVVPASAAGITKNDIALGGDEKAYDWVPARAGRSYLVELPRIRAGLGRITSPALVIYSRHDHSVDNENSRAMLKLLGSTEKTELVLERSCHVATLDYDAPLVEEKISEFVDSVVRSVAPVSGV